MSYLVFARKYRPPSFEDVIAQDHVTRTLQNAVKNDRVGSGYLFCGPRGTGKTTTARILAKALNCVNGPTPTPCGTCDKCIEIAAGSSMDVLEIDAASNTGVDDIRALRENVRYLPSGGKKRIYIIDEVHRLSGAAFDALLKTLEEPPDHVIFIFATTEPLKVPDTILSRTQRFDFKRVSTADLAENLRRIAEKEGIQIEPGALALLARKGDGSVRDSVTLLDQIAAFAGDKVSEKDVVDGLGLVDRKFLFEFIDAVAAGDNRLSLEMVKRLFDAGIDVDDFITELLEHLRLLMVLSANGTTGGLVELEAEELKEYSAQATNFSIGDIIRLMRMAGDLKRDLKLGLEERLLLETTAIKMAQMEATVRFEDVLEQLQAPGSGTGSSVGLHDGEKKKLSYKTSGTSETPTHNRVVKESQSSPTSEPMDKIDTNESIDSKQDRRVESNTDVQQLIDSSPRLKKLIEKVDGEIIGSKRIE